MKVFDPLYGAFLLPNLAKGLVMLPEIRRLSQIRLLNCLTPSLATLGEIRRFSHTLGVMNLFARWKEANGSHYPREDLDALEVSILLHDVATPPFGHLLEYLLKEERGWDHETAAVDLFLQCYAPETTGHQIFAGQTPKVLRTVKKLRVSYEKIEEILKKQHPLHHLIMGSIDFDNIDNVWRMGWALGLPGSATSAISLAESLQVSESGRLVVQPKGLSALDEWAKLRGAVYRILIFDQPTVAAQALLTRTLRTAIREGVLTPESWTMTDEELLAVLSRHPLTKKIVKQQYLGELPRPILSVQLKWKDREFGLSRETLEEQVELRLRSGLGFSPLAYVFKERGSFSKRLVFDDGRGNLTEKGETSRSLIVYLFGSESQGKRADRHSADILREVLAAVGANEDDIRCVASNVKDESIIRQFQFA